MKLLLTAFEPFGGETINPALEAVRLVPNHIKGAEIVKLTVPVVFVRSVDIVISAIERERPDAVLMIGQAGGRSAVTPEFAAINIIDAKIPDNEGIRPEGEPVAADGPAAYFSTLPVKRIAEAIRSKGITAEVSYTAGTFVCNSLMYAVLHHIAVDSRGIPAGFMHVPFTEEQAAAKEKAVPSMKLSDIRDSIVIAIETITDEL